MDPRQEAQPRVSPLGNHPLEQQKETLKGDPNQANPSSGPKERNASNTHHQGNSPT